MTTKEPTKITEKNPKNTKSTENDQEMKDKTSKKSKKSSSNSSKRNHKKSSKSKDKDKKKSKSKSKRDKDKSKHKRDRDKDKDGDIKMKPNEKKKKKRSLSPTNSKSRSRSNSRDKDRKRKRKKHSSSRRHDGFRRSYSRTPSRSRSRSRTRSRSPRYSRHRDRDRDRHHRRRRYKRRHYRSRSNSHSRSTTPSRSHSNDKKTIKKDTKTPVKPVNNTIQTTDLNGSKTREIKATAPNAMQQITKTLLNPFAAALNTNPLAAFNPIFNNLPRPNILSLTNPVHTSNTALQQLLSLSNPYKTSLGISGLANRMNPLLMNNMAAELQKQSILNSNNGNKGNDESSLFFKVHLPGMNTLTAIGGINPQITRPSRRLYVGNLPVGMGLNEQILCEFFSQCCKGLGIITLNPVLSVWLNSEQTFGFIEFRSVLDTNLSLQLFEGLQLGGRQLRFGRPVDYKEPPDNLKNYIVGGDPNNNDIWKNIEKGSPAAMLLTQQQQRKQQASIMDNNGDAKKTLDIAILNKQKAMLNAMQQLNGNDNEKESNILVLLNILTVDDLKDNSEYDDIYDDIECECEQYGNLEEVIIPKINEKGCGRVFLKYSNINEAKKCKSKCDGRKFGTNIVKCLFFDPTLYEQKEFDYDFKIESTENSEKQQTGDKVSNEQSNE